MGGSIRNMQNIEISTALLFNNNSLKNYVMVVPKSMQKLLLEAKPILIN